MLTETPDRPSVTDVWIMTRSQAGALDTSVLSVAERDRAAQSGARGTGFTLGAVLLRHAVGSRTGMLPGTIDVRRRCAVCGRAHGRPIVGGTGLTVSVTHAGDLIGVAVTDGGWVGIDIEPRGRVLPVSLAERVLSPKERAVTAGDPDAVLTVWTVKEALLKAAGAGLGGGIPAHVLEGVDPHRVVNTRPWGHPAGRVVGLPLGPGHVGALALPADSEPRIRRAHV